MTARAQRDGPFPGSVAAFEQMKHFAINSNLDEM
jgi:hypothetical protein